MFPIISIIVPVHNAEVWLSRCLDSILVQTLKEMEIILVENGSSDGSLKICQEYAARYRNIKLYIGDFADPSMARNLGIEKSVGEYLVFVDADDYVEPTLCEDMLQAIESTSAEVAYCNYFHEHEGGKHREVQEWRFKENVVRAKWLQHEILARRANSAPWAWMWPRKIFKECSFPPGGFFEDHKCIFEWMDHVQLVAMVRKPLYHYFVRKSSTCSNAPRNPRLCRDFFDAEKARLDYVLCPQSFCQCDYALEVAMFTFMVGYLSNYLSLIDKPSIDVEAIRMRQDLILSYSRIQNHLCSAKIRLQVQFLKYFWSLYTLLFRCRKVLKLQNVD